MSDLSGRTLFKRIKPLIKVFVIVDSYLPRKLNNFLFVSLRGIGGKVGIVIRYILVKNLAKGGQRKVLDYKLSRYACYLIVQNADPRKKVIALAQTYFAIQTRKQELSEKEYNELTEDEKSCYH